MKHNRGPALISALHAERQHDKRELVAAMVRERCSDEEIAAVLGTSTGTVSSFVYRLRKYGYELPWRGHPPHHAHPWRRPLD